MTTDVKNEIKEVISALGAQNKILVSLSINDGLHSEKAISLAQGEIEMALEILKKAIGE